MITFVAFVMCLAWLHVLYGSTVAHKAFVNKDKTTRFKTISGGKNSYSFHQIIELYLFFYKAKTLSPFPPFLMVQ